MKTKRISKLKAKPEKQVIFQESDDEKQSKSRKPKSLVPATNSISKSSVGNKRSRQRKSSFKNDKNELIDFNEIKSDVEERQEHKKMETDVISRSVSEECFEVDKAFVINQPVDQLMSPKTNKVRKNARDKKTMRKRGPKKVVDAVNAADKKKEKKVSRNKANDAQSNQKNETYDDNGQQVCTKIEHVVRDNAKTTPKEKIESTVKKNRAVKKTKAEDNENSVNTSTNVKKTLRARPPSTVEPKERKIRKAKQVNTDKPTQPKTKKNLLDENGNFKHKFREFEVMVSNCHFSLTEQDLLTHFSICPGISKIRLMRKFNGSFSGNAFIKFKNAESMDLALSLNASTIKNRRIYVQKTQNTIDMQIEYNKRHGIVDTLTTPSSTPRVIFISNLAASVSKESLKNCFAQYGVIDDVRLIKSLDESTNKFAFIDFADSDSADKAVKANGLLHHDKNLFIKFAYIKDNGLDAFGRKIAPVCRTAEVEKEQIDRIVPESAMQLSADHNDTQPVNGAKSFSYTSILIDKLAKDDIAKMDTGLEEELDNDATGV
jgi:hypothetical protein